MKPTWKMVFAWSLFTLAHVCGAEVFYTEEQIKGEMFPSATFVLRTVEIDRELLKEIKRQTSARLMSKTLKIWEIRKDGQLAGWLFNASVLGKHENIRYALAIDESGGVRRVEVMEYLETHGSDVGDTLWRAQFYGKSLADPIKLGRDIDNISGATLSCRHLTDGIKGLLIIHDRLLKAKAA